MIEWPELPLEGDLQNLSAEEVMAEKGRLIKRLELLRREGASPRDSRVVEIEERLWQVAAALQRHSGLLERGVQPNPSGEQSIAEALGETLRALGDRPGHPGPRGGWEPRVGRSARPRPSLPP